MAIRVLLPQPILPAGYEYLREHGYEVVDGRGFTEEDIIADIGDCDADHRPNGEDHREDFGRSPQAEDPGPARCGL